MKIIYSISDRFGASAQLERFLQRNKNVKIAGFYSTTKNFNRVDWLLDACYHLPSVEDSQKIFQSFKYKNFPKINYKSLVKIIEDVEQYKPDLIISDAEPIFAHLAKLMNIPLWKFSSLHILDQAIIPKNTLGYSQALNKTKIFLKTLPEAKTFICSPWGDFFDFELKEKVTWVRPELNYGSFTYRVLASFLCNERQKLILPLIKSIYHDVEFRKEYNLSSTEIFFSDGNTNSLSDALYYGLTNIYVIPNMNDAESLINASLVKFLDLGIDLSQIENYKHKAASHLEKFISYKDKMESVESKFLTLTDMVKEYETNNF